MAEQRGPTGGNCHLPLAEGQNAVGTGRHRRTAENKGGFKMRERNLETRKAWWEGVRRGGAGTARGGRGRQLLCWVCSVLLTLLFWQVQGWPENPPPFSSPLQCEEHTQAKPIFPSPICFNNTWLDNSTGFFYSGPPLYR